MSEVHERFLSWGRFFSKSLYLPGKCQTMTILLLPKPYLAIENNPSQMWPETALIFSYISLPKLSLSLPSGEVKDLPSHSLLLAVHQNPLKCCINLVLNKVPYLSRNRMWNTIFLGLLVWTYHVLDVQPSGCSLHVSQPKMLILVLLIWAFSGINIQITKNFVIPFFPNIP